MKVTIDVLALNKEPVKAIETNISTMMEHISEVEDHCSKEYLVSMVGTLSLLCKIQDALRGKK